jgi:hypothetical protein
MIRIIWIVSILLVCGGCERSPDESEVLMDARKFLGVD